MTMKIYIFILIVLISTITFAQVKVSGKVVDENGEPISFADVFFKGSTKGTVSDENGKFYLESDKKYGILIVNFLGFDRKEVALKSHNFDLKIVLKEEAARLDAVEIYSGKVKKKGNPAIAILRKIWAHKRQNGIYLFNQYQNKKYEKIEFDLNNVDEKLKKSKIFKGLEFIFDQVDSSNITGKAYLPIFINEAVYKVYGKNKAPKQYKENLVANKNSGFQNHQSMIAFVKQLYTDYNIYNNYIKIFDKSFTSPVSRTGPSVYNYVLADSSFIGNKWCYKIVYYPRRKNELTFKGQFWVNDTTFALKKITMQATRSANINWVKELYLEQEFDVLNDSVFLLKKDYMMSDFALKKKDKSKGIYGKRTTIYSDYNFNIKHKESFYAKRVNDYSKEIYAKSDGYWKENRLEVLSKDEKGIYKMLDTLRTMRKFKQLFDITATLYSGYWQITKSIDYGPIFSSIGANDVEGTRIRTGARTFSNLNDLARGQIFVAYGTLDKKLKYGISGKWMINKQNRFTIFAGNRKDVEQTGFSLTTINDVLNRSFASAAFFTRGDNFRLTSLNLTNIGFEFEPVNNLQFKVSGTYKTLASASPLFNIDYYRDNTYTDIKSDITQSEVDVSVRYTPNRVNYGYGVERGVSNSGRYPILFLSYTKGFKGLINSDFNYQKLQLYYKQPYQLGGFGRMHSTLEIGKTFGQVPILLMDAVPGNQTLFMAPNTFDLLDYYEFVTDKYAALHIENNFNGRLFSRIPILRKLNLREIVGIRGIIGDVSQANINLNASGINYRAPKNIYWEWHVGVANILKILRIDFVFRGNYKDIPGASQFTIKGGAGFYF
ncbi:MAG: DUF5686 and carboxypeptidase regulatory-like domain-containing protein [Flavobacteriaceae bacterium]|nr:DUF5686 and carboxypeptidase regulatory-like domain-containing protein [Flavobacteriaceae bacterium]